MIKAIVGANWGDEGKGKITDICAADADIVVRFQGGSNAGHTIINKHGRFALHQLPSGIFYPNISNIIANGVALNVEYLLKEIEQVKEKGVEFNLLISNRAHVLMPHHVLLDTYEEERLGDKKFGSTKSGIAPLYSDKYAKTGIQVWELFDDENLKERVARICEKNNIIFKYLYKSDPMDENKLFETLKQYGEKIQPFVADTSKFLHDAIKENKHILLEGQLGALKDTDHGIYPYVTSSSTLAGFASVGAGIPPYEIKNILAVTKAYSSAVGEGAFVSEIFGEEADTLRMKGGDKGEFGATTGRPRRVGYFDVVATKYGCRLQGATEVAITGIDVLSYMDKIPVCVGYKINGSEIITDFPTTGDLNRAKPIYEELPGWKEEIRGIKDYDKLPINARKYVEFIEKSIGVKITLVSNGPKRDEIIIK